MHSSVLKKGDDLEDTEREINKQKDMKKDNNVRKSSNSDGMAWKIYKEER